MNGCLRYFGRTVETQHLPAAKAAFQATSHPLNSKHWSNSAGPGRVRLRFPVHSRGLFLILGLWLAVATSASTCLVANCPAADGPEDNQPEAGNLLIIGGGKIAPETRNRFFELAGGSSARIVLIPTASEEVERPEFLERFLAPWKEYAPQSLIILHARNRESADNLEFIRPLQEATGVWIGGGVQTRLASRYLHTRVEDELRGVRRRGGVVAGTSAGAAIMTRTMIADGMKRPVMAEGFDFFRGAIVDQHFTQRYRMPRLSAAVRQHPGRFGVGIDEETGLLVSGDQGTVLGRGQVRFVATAKGRRGSSPPLLVRDYAPGEEVALGFWRDNAWSEADAAADSRQPSRGPLVAESHIAPLLSYSLLHDYDQVDSRR
jgi:cyanophycinase